MVASGFTSDRTALIMLLLAESALRSAIETAAHTLGYRVQLAMDPAHSALVQIAELQPALIITDSAAIPRWVADVRADPSTRRIPVLAVGALTDTAHARNMGITDMLSADELQAVLPDALTARVRLFRHAAQLADQCEQAPSALVLKGLHEFNTHEFYECHETLEAAWKAENGPVRDLYRVILQVGLAYYQIERGNYHGASKMFLRTLQWFGTLPDQCQGIDVAQLRADASAARAHLESLGAEHIATFDRALLKPLIYAHADAQEGSQTHD